MAAQHSQGRSRTSLNIRALRIQPFFMFLLWFQVPGSPVDAAGAPADTRAPGPSLGGGPCPQGPARQG